MRGGRSRDFLQRFVRARVPPVHRTVVLLALVACEPTADVPDRDPPTVRWVYPPPPLGLPLGAPVGRLGRGQTPQPVASLGIAAGADGDELAALQHAALWP